MDNELIIKAISGLLAGQEEMASTTSARFRDVEKKFREVESTMHEKFGDIEDAMDKFTGQIREVLTVLQGVAETSAGHSKADTELQRKVEDLEARVARLEEAS